MRFQTLIVLASLSLVANAVPVDGESSTVSSPAGAATGSSAAGPATTTAPGTTTTGPATADPSPLSGAKDTKNDVAGVNPPTGAVGTGVSSATPTVASSFAAATISCKKTPKQKWVLTAANSDQATLQKFNSGLVSNLLSKCFDLKTVGPTLATAPSEYFFGQPGATKAMPDLETAKLFLTWTMNGGYSDTVTVGGAQRRGAPAPAAGGQSAGSKCFDEQLKAVTDQLKLPAITCTEPDASSPATANADAVKGVNPPANAVPTGAASGATSTTSTSTSASPSATGSGAAKAKRDDRAGR